jgi:hypothetical protein
VHDSAVVIAEDVKRRGSAVAQDGDFGSWKGRTGEAGGF